MHKRIITLISSLILPLMAQEASSIGKKVIGSGGFAANMDSLPRTSWNLDYKEIQSQVAPSTADLLSTAPGIHVQKSQQGGGSPNLRGFGANAILLTIDGVRLNNAIYRGGNLHNIISLDPNSLRQLEVLYGPGNVIHGSDALGGVISAYTLRGELDSLSGFHGSARLRLGTAEQEKTLNANIELPMQQAVMHTILTYSQFGDRRIGDKLHNTGDFGLKKHYIETKNNLDAMVENKDPLIQKGSGYSYLSLINKIYSRFTPTLSSEASLYYSSTSDIGRSDRLNQYSGDTLKYSEWYYGPQNWTMGRLLFEYTGLPALADTILWNNSMQNYLESRHSRKYGSSQLRSQEENVTAYQSTLQGLKKNSLGNLSWGLDAVYNRVASDAQYTDIISHQLKGTGTRYPSGGSDYTTMAGWLHLESAPQKWRWNIGSRYSHTFLESRMQAEDYPFNKIENDFGAITWSAGLLWSPLDHLGIRGQFAKGFRAPNVDDIAKVFDSEPGTVTMPNPDLKPEYSYTLEGGLRWHSSRIYADFSLYTSILKEALIRKPATWAGADSLIYQGEMSQVLTMQNAQSAWIAGAALDLDWKINKKVKLSQRLSWNQGEYDNGEALRHITPPQGITKIKLKLNKWNFAAWCDYALEMQSSDLAREEAAKVDLYALDKNGKPWVPAWWDTGLEARWEYSTGSHLLAGVKNLLDKRYRKYSSGIHEPGRNIYFEIRQIW